MAQNIAILGAGFIGTNLIRYYVEQGANISVLDRGIAPSEFQNPQINWHQGIAENKEHVTNTIEGCDTVFHLLASTVPGDQVSVSNELFGAVTQMLDILDCCKQSNIKRFVFMSSSSVYGLQSQIPISENVAPAPISTHGIQKLTLEHYVRLFTENYGIDSKIIRLSNPYGPGQNPFGRQGFISIVIGNILRDKVTHIRGDGGSIRDFIHINDVVKACANIANLSSDERIFNLGSGVGVSLNEVLQIFERIMERSIPVEYGDIRSQDIPQSVLDVSLIRANVNFVDHINLENGIRNYLSYHNLV